MEPDGMHLMMLMELADSFRRPLSSWKGSVHLGKVPKVCRKANAMPMFKNRQERGSEEQQAHQPKKITSKIFMETKHMKDKNMSGNSLHRLNQEQVISDQPHCLLWEDDWICRKLEEQWALSTLTLAGLFTSLHSILIRTFERHGLDGWTTKWLDYWGKMVVVNSSKY